MIRLHLKATCYSLHKDGKAESTVEQMAKKTDLIFFPHSFTRKVHSDSFVPAYKDLHKVGKKKIFEEQFADTIMVRAILEHLCLTMITVND